MKENSLNLLVESNKRTRHFIYYKVINYIFIVTKRGLSSSNNEKVYKLYHQFIFSTFIGCIQKEKRLLKREARKKNRKIKTLFYDLLSSNSICYHTYLHCYCSDRMYLYGMYFPCQIKSYFNIFTQHSNKTVSQISSD